MPALQMRSQSLLKFERDIHRVWDVEDAQHKKRTVLYESTTTTVFKQDSEKKEVAVREFGIVELVHVDKGGFQGYKASELRSFLDPSKVMERANEVFSKPT
jgi:hypothetical protein